MFATRSFQVNALRDHLERFDGEMSELLSARNLDRESRAAVEARSHRNLAQCESAMIDLLLAHDAEADLETQLDPNIAYIDVVSVSTSWFGGMHGASVKIINVT